MVAHDVPTTAGAPAQRASHVIRDVQQTSCCIVGGGPAGAVLALLLARQGIGVTLLEARADFDRDFRGDTLHPSTLEVMDQIGLADRLLALPHAKNRSYTIMTPAGLVRFVDFTLLRTRFPYIAMMPQARFLDFIVAEARRYPAFTLVMSASVHELVKEDGVVRGVRYQGRDGWHEVRALLTVGADGRFSKVRKLAAFEPIKTSSAMDVLWFRLSHQPSDAPDAITRVGGGSFLIQLDRGDEWQFGYVIPKGSYKQLQSAGIETLRRSVVELMPWLADRIDELQDWKQVALLSVEADRLPRWYRSGLLLIGDAAHVMSPVGGNGINYAIMDAVAAANLLSGPLKAGGLELGDLAAVQCRREWPTRLIQALVAGLQKNALGQAPPSAFRWMALVSRLPLVRSLPARLLGFGIQREHVWPALRKGIEAAALSGASTRVPERS